MPLSPNLRIPPLNLNSLNHLLLLSQTLLLSQNLSNLQLSPVLLVFAQDTTEAPAAAEVDPEAC